jgi:hypothetical protein
MLAVTPLIPLTLTLETKPTGFPSGTAESRVGVVTVKLVKSARLVNATSNSSKVPICFFIFDLLPDF